LNFFGISLRESLKRGKKSNKLILKLGDFGFATLVTPDKKLEQYCGTPIYAAPEVKNEHFVLMRNRLCFFICGSS
jgi:serine/threonine protein kinase